MKDMTNENEFKTPTLGEYLKGEEPAKEPETENNHISKEMDTNNAPVEQLDADATKNEELANEQAPVEAPAKSAESDTHESAAPAAEDGTTTPVIFKPLEKRKIYSTSELMKLGVRLARIVDNRDLDEKAVQKKIASIKKVKGVISPSQLVPARTCLEQGHEVKLLNGDEVTMDTEHLDSIYVIVDGQHRDEAVRRILANPKEALKFENYYYLPLIDAYNVSDLLRETNVATFPWKDRQYLNNLLQVKSDSPINLDLLKEVQAHPKATTKAALHWLTLSTGRTIYSRDIVAAMVDDTKLAEISKVETTRFKAGKKLFDAAEEALGDAAGTTAYSDWSIDQINNNPTETAVNMADKLARFFKWLKENSLAAAYKTIKGQKATEDQAPVTKDAMIQQQLTKDFKLFSKSASK